MTSFFQRMAEGWGRAVSKPCEVEILCLAWSRKCGGRCLAGLRTDGGGWVRPVGDGAEGALPEGTEARVLDTLRLSLSQTCPKPHQPENWRLRRVWYNPWHKPCQLVARPARESMSDRLRPHLSDGPLLLGSRADRVSEDHFAEQPAAASLALIQPEGLRWLVKTNRVGERRTRAIFCWWDTVYNLALTDPVWEQRLSSLEVGSYPHADIAPDSERAVFLTISLSGPHNGDCYKLVAAVIVT